MLYNQQLMIPVYLAQNMRMTKCQVFEKSYYVVLKDISTSFNGITFYRFG